MNQASVDTTNSPKAPRDKAAARSISGQDGVCEEDNLESAAFSVNDDDEVRARKLIAAIKRGNHNAFGELVSRYQRQVAALAYKMVNNYDEAADITQIVFVKMYDNIWRYDRSRKFYSWLYRITINAAIDYMRKHKRHRHEPLEEFHEMIDGTRSDPEVSYRRRQITDSVMLAAGHLSEKQRSVFVLRDLEGCAIDEVATSMEISEATARWYLHRARIKVRQELKRTCPQALKFLGVV
ncbi:MAG: RNA polymerase sigma factor [Candidatus Zixiibacteriota bacterium]|nr:MAG: RNA polymerase sigma factor [candidate division Zixibacteria bacterium]